MNINQRITKKDVAKYVFLPGIIPRTREFIESGFGSLAYLMAIIYSSANLIPSRHPYLNPANIGRYGVRHVVAEAANRLIIKKENIDQIIIFFALMLGFILLVVQFAAMIFGFVMQPAFAALTFDGLFATPSCPWEAAPTNENCIDIAFVMLDQIFGVPNVFNSKIGPADGTRPLFNVALTNLLELYSMLILIVGVIIFLYYVVLIVGETAVTGTPFGRRFAHIWVPIRLVTAVGLLVPVNYGLNSAQYITLYAAKWGSGFATNAWIQFNGGFEGMEALPNGLGLNNGVIVARPKSPDITPIVQFMSIVTTCAKAWATQIPNQFGPGRPEEIKPYLIRNTPLNESKPAFTTPYSEALEFYNNGDVVIRFGSENITAYKKDKGNVKPICGEIKIPTSNVIDTTGAFHIQQEYYKLLEKMWNDGMVGGSVLFDISRDAVRLYLPRGGGGGANEELPDNTVRINSIDDYQTRIQGEIEEAHEIQLDHIAGPGGGFAVPEALLERGWAGAGIWYNKIAEWNGSLFKSAISQPIPSAMPLVMERIAEEAASHNSGTDAQTRFQPFKPDGDDMDFLSVDEKEVADVLNIVYQYWLRTHATVNNDAAVSGNVVFDVLETVFGVNGLFDLRSQQDIHPLAQLTALGSSMVNSSIMKLMGALISSAIGGASEILYAHQGSAWLHASKTLVGLTTVTLTVGFVLAYVLPFLPFIYFFFAVGAWIKTIFEAMVGVPLWALAHLRVDGNGLPGQAASNGYFLIFEIFVRPILTVFGLLAGLAVFNAMAMVLNETWDVVVQNVSGFDCFNNSDCTTFSPNEYKRSIIDEFFFTIIYAIVIYLMGTSSFKMIDQIPQNILRWMGAGVQAFGDQRDDPTGSMTQYVAFGGAQITEQGIGALTTGAQGIGQAAGGVGRAFMGRNAPASAATGAPGRTP